MGYEHSNVARIRQQIVHEEMAAHLGLTGPAITSRHEFINARATRGAVRILQLVEQGRCAEAQALMNIPNWGVEEEEKEGMSHFDTFSLRK